MIVYVVGTHGVGKTAFACKAGPDAEVCFRIPESTDQPYEQIPDIPWVTLRVRDGQRVHPETCWAASRDFMCYDFCEQESVRGLANIPLEASVVRVSADALYAVALNELQPDQRAETFQKLNDCLESRFDVVIHETYPLLRPREQDRIVALSVPYSEMRKRQSTLQWNGRLDLGRAHYIEAARMSAQPEHPYCHGANSNTRLWWRNGRWCPTDEVSMERIELLGNWYHPQLLGGVYSTDPAVASYEGRWAALGTLFASKLDGTKVLDIGANSGFNAIRLAERGAMIVAVEPDARVIQQYQAVVEMGPFPMKVTDRITYHNRAAEAEDVAEFGSFDTAIMSACHYYINRSTKEPFKYAGEKTIGVRGLRTTLWAVLDTLRGCSRRLLIPTNRAHADREENPYPDAEPEWIKLVLEDVGYQNVTIHDGYAHTPIVEAFS